MNRKKNEELARKWGVDPDWLAKHRQKDKSNLIDTLHQGEELGED